MQSRQPDSLAPREVEAFILAGGASRRMGRDKARLPFGGAPLAVALARRVAPAVARVRLVAKRDSQLEDLGLEMVYDESTEHALVHGIRAALAADGAEWRWLLACDMPGIDVTVLRALASTQQATGALGAAPRLATQAEPEPLPSLWHRRLVDAVTPEWGLGARDWVRHAGLASWEVPAAWGPRFANVNTPSEWDALRFECLLPEAT